MFETNAQQNDSLNYVFLNFVYENELEKAEMALMNGADVNFTTNKNISAIHYSVSNQDLLMTEMLLRNGAEVDQADIFGYTPLMLAASLGNDSLMFILVIAGADVNHRNNVLETPLHLAVLSGNPIALDMLLFYDANPDIPDADSLVPLHLAAYNGLDNMIDILLFYSANPDKRDTKNQNPCFYAVYSGSLSSLQLLISAGCDYLSRNTENLNITEIAFLSGHEEMIRLLDVVSADSLSYMESNFKKLNIELDAKLLWRTTLVNDLKKSKSLLREYGIPRPFSLFFGPVYPQFSMLGFSDFYVCPGLQFTEVNYGFYLGVAYGTRLWRNSVLYEKNDDTFFQLKEYRSFIQAELLKYITIAQMEKYSGRLDLVFGLRTPFTMANYRAMKMKEAIRFTYAPALGFDFVKRGMKLSIGYQYWDYDSRNFSKHQIIIGIAGRL
jgi:ankyrin repeat protein